MNIIYGSESIGKFSITYEYYSLIQIRIKNLTLHTNYYSQISIHRQI